MNTYLYPQDLKAKPHLWLWGLRDFAILCVAVLVSAFIMVNSGILLPGALALCYGFLTIRADDTTILDYLRNAARFFLTTQQYFEWRLE